MTTTSPPTSSNRGFLIAVVGLIVVGLALVAFVATRSNSGDTTAGSDGQTATVDIVGTALPAMSRDANITDATTDPAGGSVAPTLTGTDFAGNTVSIEPDGRAKAIYFLAHWCPHCQDEVPVVQTLIDEGRVPDGLDVYAVSTAVDVGRGNFPPEAWLSDEGFAAITVRDDEESSAFTAFGGSSFPYVVYLNADHELAARSAGGIPADTSVTLWELAATG